MLSIGGENETMAQTKKGKSMSKKPKIGLALSGGGALGYAHIGFLQAMKEYKFEVDVVSGTSMGSIIGVLYCAGYSPIEILDLVDKENMNKIINVIKLNSSFGRGFFNHDKLSKALEKALPSNDFSSLKKKFYCCVTNFNKASYKFVGQGEFLKEYIVASASIPVVYEPKEVEGEMYVDGGVMQNLPVEPLVNEKCDIIIGVDVISVPNQSEIKGLVNIFARSMSLSISSNTESWANKCDYVITPNLENYTILDFEKAQELFDIGYEIGIVFFEDYKKQEAKNKKKNK
ncbi:MAG: patatin-like phospholipase family protein [Bacteroidales bacterium]|nr:patatin-like phospholipase family protein [Bacteroidales bacterium]MDX9798547.1 patatin-like phospholipase family protein [Bacteroidales bacterium]